MLTVTGKELGGDEFHEMTILPLEKTSDTGGPSAIREQPVASQAIGTVSISYPKCDIAY